MKKSKLSKIKAAHIFIVRRQFTVQLLLIAIYTVANANVGGATLKPGITGDPIILGSTSIGVLKENLLLECFEDGKQEKCRFNASYFLSSKLNEVSEVFCVFYGIAADSIRIWFNRQPVEPSFDSSLISKVDSIVHRTIFDKTNGEAGWYDWKPLVRHGFKIKFSPGGENILKIQGVITMKPTQCWYGIYAPAMYCKHPFLNKKAGQGSASFKYLINPIYSWSFSGPINITLTYPRHWEIKAGFITYKECIDQLSAQKEREYSSETFTIRKTVRGTYYDAIYFDVIQKRQFLFAGGPEIGIGGQKNYGAMMRYSWDFGSEINWNNQILYSLPIETDCRKKVSFCPTIMVGRPWCMLLIPSISAGLGAVVPLTEKQKARFRIRGDLNFGLIGLSLNFDNRGSEWKKTIYGTISF